MAYAILLGKGLPPVAIMCFKTENTIYISSFTHNLQNLVQIVHYLYTRDYP